MQRLGNGERVRRITGKRLIRELNHECHAKMMGFLPRIGLDPAGPLLEGLIKLERVLSSSNLNTFNPFSTVMIQIFDLNTG